VPVEVSLPLFVAVPLGVAFLMPLVGKARRGEAAADVVAFLAALAACAGGLWMFANTPGTLVYWVGQWRPPGPVGINLVCDGLTRLLLLVLGMVVFAAIVFSLRYMRRFTDRPRYYCLFFLMVAGMNGVVLTGDIFNLYVFLEVASVASYALVAFGCESEELEASFKYIIQSAVASGLILIGIGILYNITGTLNMAQIAAILSEQGSNSAAILAACFFFVGFGLKAGMVPFHAWLPDAHPSAPAPISAMLSGLFIKAVGVYSLCRLFFSVFGVADNPAYANVLVTMGMTSMVIGVLMAIGQWDLKRLLAFSSISQMGYVVFGLGIGGWVLSHGGARYVAGLAVFGGLFHLFNHAAFKSLLFLCSGALEYATGTRKLKEMGGLLRRMPVSAGCLRIGALSISGIPPFNGFWSKLFIVIACVAAKLYILAAATAAVSFMTLLLFVKVQRYTLHGKLPAGLRRVKEVPALMCAAMVALAVICVGAGLLFPYFQDTVLTPAVDLVLTGTDYATAVLGG